MNEVVERVEATAVEQARPQQRQSLIQKIAGKYAVEPGKLFETLKQVAFRQRPDSRTGEVVVVTNEQMMALLIVSDQYGLNPFTKEIYAFPDKANGIVPVLGVDGWIRIIQAQPEYDGEEFVFSDTKNKAGIPEWIEVRMYRKDRTRPTVIREYFDEVQRDTQPWRSHPRRMLRHKGLIQCARVAFGFGGIYDEDEAARIIEGDVRVVRDSTDDEIEARAAAAAARRAAAAPATAPALEQTKPVTIEQTIDVEARETQHAAAANAVKPKEDAKPESVPADSTPSDHGGGAPAADAPASKASNGPAVTAKSIERAMRGAKSMDALNDAASLINALPLGEQKSLNELYKERAAAFGVE